MSRAIQVYREVVSGLGASWEHKFILLSIALAIVILVLEYGGVVDSMIDKVEANNITSYNRPQDAKDLALIELNEYVNDKAGEIYERQQHIYKEQARLEALEAVREELVQLASVSPHVDYDYMLRVVESSL